MAAVDAYGHGVISEKDRADIERVVRDLEDSKRHHDTFVTFVERMYRAYRGVLEKQSEAAQWTSKQHPALGLQQIESVIANMIDDKTTFMMRPHPLIDDPERVQEYIQGARALEHVVRYEMELDSFSRKQRPFALQNSIAGLTAAKISWDYAEGTGTQYVQQDRDVLHPETGEVIGTYPQLVEQEHTRIVRDGPTFEVVDVRDLFWPDNAQDVQGATYVIHRVWMSMDELRELERDGVYQNVDKVTSTRDIQSWEGQQWRSDELFLTNRKRNMIEVLEWWGRDGRVLTVANRRVLLRRLDKRPYHHGLRPFVIASSMPQPFQFVGVSDMEIIEPLQRLVWTTMNQRIDNVALLNNAIIILRDTADDQDYEFAPGEFWTVEDPTEVTMWQPNPLPAEVSLGSENALRADMNNITGGMGSVSGDMQQMDSATATGVSAMTTIAQKRLSARRQQFAYSYQDAGTQIVPLIQQFIRRDRLVPILGAGGALAFERVSPLQMQGNYVCSVQSISESLMRQERRAEAQALFTLSLQAAPIAAASGKPIAIDQSYRDLLEAFDKDDPDRYFAAEPQPQVAAAGGDAQQMSPDGAPQGPGGVTSPLAAGISSPSNAVSQSPAVAMQRMLASRGAGRNA